MSKSSEAVKRWRRRTKERMVEALGGKCCVCGYDRCTASMDFHHIDPNEKDFHFGNIRANPVRWSELIIELRKCVLVCRNCHGEIHVGCVALPATAPRFNEIFADYKTTDLSMEPCPICGKEKSTRLITCSRSCAAKKTGKVDWESIDLLDLIKKKNKSQIGELLGVTESAVRKRLKKLAGEAGFEPA